MYTLEKTDERVINGKKTPIRIYKNTLTGNLCTTYEIRKDISGNTWWGFEDLFSLPFVRQLQAKKVIELYGNGLALEDIKLMTGQMKLILKSQDPEKYEKVFAKVLEMENLSETMADPVKQCYGLCTVYLLFNDEKPDIWDNQTVSAKMTAMSVDIESQSFFLNWWIEVMKQSGKVLKGLSQIASTVNQLDTKTTAPLNY